MRSTLLPASLVLLGGLAAARGEQLHGRVEDVQGTANSFFVDCTGTALTSSAFNLNLFVGQSVAITGNWNGSSASPSVDVVAIQAITEEFEICGNPTIGESFQLGATATPGTTIVFGLSPAGGFGDLGASGVAFLDLNPTLFFPGGVIPPVGNKEVTLQVPNSPALVGVELFGQAALVQAGGFTLSNPDCKTIEAN